MDTSRGATGYDLFKLIVAIILLLLFLLLLGRTTALPFRPAATEFSATPNVRSSPSVTPDANPIAVIATSTPLSATVTSRPSPLPTKTIESTPTILPSPAETKPAAPTATPSPSPTPTPVVESTSTPAAQSPSTTSACESAAPRSRLQAGMNATILRRLNFRSSPGIRNNWLLTNIPGTNVEVVGGPECLPHVTGAYIWWQIKLSDGRIGWSAEGSIHGTFYFMEPMR